MLDMKITDIFIKNRVNDDYENAFKESILTHNMTVIRSFSLVGAVLQIALILLATTHILNVGIRGFSYMFVFLFATITFMVVVFLIKDKPLPLIKSIASELSVYVVHGIALCIMSAATAESFIDISLVLVIYLVVNTTILTKPFCILIRNLITYTAFMLLIHFTGSHLNIYTFINFTSFVLISCVSSIFAYNNQRRLFIERSNAYQANQQLEILSNTDQLTGLCNRRRIDKELENEISNSGITGDPLSIVLFDIDFFKDVNDTHGHITGDKVLVEMAALLEKNLRPTDVAGRWGGEEFIVICKGTTQSDAKVIAERLRSTIENHVFFEGVSLTISLGIADVHPNFRVRDALMQADKALYQAKQNGRNQTVTFDECTH